MIDFITLDYIENAGIPPVIQYAVPVMLFLVGLEWYIMQRRKKQVYEGKDLLASASIGVGNLVVSALIKTAIILVYIFFYNISPVSIPTSWWSFILCFFAIDLARYWAHRLSHEWRFLWATHVTHHSSTNYNFSVSFRLSWVQHIKIIFFIPIALAGFHPVEFFIGSQIAVLYQFWIHTEMIKKLPKPIEWFFTTPSHHRVHHATNPKYIDKNYGSTFIIWDRMFGSFQAEEEQAVYGITKPIKSYNPVTLNFHEFVDIFKDVRKAKSLKEAWRYAVGSPQELVQKEKEKTMIKNNSVSMPLSENGYKQKSKSKVV